MKKPTAKLTTAAGILAAVSKLEKSLETNDYERTIRLRAALRYLESALKELK